MYEPSVLRVLVTYHAQVRDNGMIAEDHALQAPGKEALVRATEALDARFPAREVDVYLASLLALDPGSWEGLGDVLEARRSASRAAR